MDQIVTLAVRAPQVLFIDAGNPHHGPDVAVAAKPCDQPSQQLAGVDVIRLCPARSPVDLHAGGVDYQTFDAAALEKPRQPERVVTGLVVEHNCGCPTAQFGASITARSKLRHQIFRISTSDRI
jgi:hypothetical protein